MLVKHVRVVPGWLRYVRKGINPLWNPVFFLNSATGRHSDHYTAPFKDVCGAAYTVSTRHQKPHNSNACWVQSNQIFVQNFTGNTKPKVVWFETKKRTRPKDASTGTFPSIRHDPRRFPPVVHFFLELLQVGFRILSNLQLLQPTFTQKNGIRKWLWTWPLVRTVGGSLSACQFQRGRRTQLWLAQRVEIMFSKSLITGRRRTHSLSALLLVSFCIWLSFRTSWGWG